MIQASSIQADPIVLQIVEGALASAEAEVEAAIERTARSPMIREARDFRGGIHDRHCRKLTGRSYSALVQPIVRDFPIETMRPGDVFFHNDVYGSEGGIGHLPDLCVHRAGLPRGRGRGVRPGLRPSRRHRRRGARLDAQPRRPALPGRADRPAGQALRRGPAERRPDPDPGAQLAAARRACAATSTPRSRPAGWAPTRSPPSSAATAATQVEACFEAILARTTETFRRELLEQDPRRHATSGRTTPSTTASIRPASTRSGSR